MARRRPASSAAPRDLVPIEQVAERFSVSVRTVRAWRDRQVLHSWQLPGTRRLYFSEAELDTLPILSRASRPRAGR